jgi:hypothetical protein
MIHTVDLTPTALKTVHTTARARHDDYEDGDNIKQTRAWSVDEGDTHIRGLKGEVAFADLYGFAPDLEQHDTGDGGVDFAVSWTGHDTADVTVDVKQYRTRRTRGCVSVKRRRVCG